MIHIDRETWWVGENVDETWKRHRTYCGRIFDAEQPEEGKRCLKCERAWLVERGFYNTDIWPFPITDLKDSEVVELEFLNHRKPRAILEAIASG